MKTVAKRIIGSLGYEIHKAVPKPDYEPMRDELIDGPWISYALQTANRNYRPQNLQYRRTPGGDDVRLKYLVNFLDLRGLRVLEMGSHEGYHSIVIDKMGAKELVAIDSRPANIEKCNRIKEKYKLDNATFLVQDIELLASGKQTPLFSPGFDLVFCLGVLYHMPDPAKILAWFRSVAPVLFLGTHYAKESETAASYKSGGNTYRVKEWKESGYGDPLSGMSPVSTWLRESDLIAILYDVGYSRVDVLGHESINGFPDVTILAEV